MSEYRVRATAPPTRRRRAAQRPRRASAGSRSAAAYDRATVDAILDGAIVGHVAWVREGQPYATPTAVWRQGDRLYWHGSSASRMLRAADGQPVCVTVTHFDGLVLARSGFNHSVNYRSAMVLGTAHLVTDEAEKESRSRPSSSTSTRDAGGAAPDDVAGAEGDRGRCGWT